MYCPIVYLKVYSKNCIQVLHAPFTLWSGKKLQNLFASQVAYQPGA